MKVNEVMNTDTFWTEPTTMIIDIARAMREHDVGSLPVVEGDRLIGIVTDRDLAIRGVAEGKDGKSVTVREVMTEEIFSVLWRRRHQRSSRLHAGETHSAYSRDRSR